ncbi:MAG: sigma-54-dependent Fis family transcriptional regulator [Magnetococcales bacterium]|nr:sigma-54-dependent Fis family transcriptional regulator [Magnetococcales bacterium]MBF0438097.1 sigma-54-dependent Fis family transcriptional regulator [Magnetococcales bacterium]
MADILVCDDERNLRELLCLALEGNGHKTLAAANGTEAIQMLERLHWDLLITDLRLPDISGLEILRRAKNLEPERPALLMTAFASASTAVTAMKEGAFDYLEKPFAMEEFHLAVSRALEQGALKQENLRLRQAVGACVAGEEIIGVSPAMRRVLEMARRAARTDASVLITGESGTGKELIARYIHANSTRSQGPFVAVSCAAVPETLIESELFGHVKGAFTGAISHRLGIFVEADHGTVLLDEIGETPLSLQAKLLRVLQERVVRAVGGSGEKAINVRLLAATNRDLSDEIAAGRFREDLLYRVNVVNLHLPPLRQRREDIPLLITRFVEKYARRYGLSITGLAPEVMACLMRYSFPGNVRELENVVEGAVALTVEGRVELEALPEAVRRGEGSKQNFVFHLPEEGLDLETHLLHIESCAMEQALTLCNGSKTKAAELLGMSFRTFRYRLGKVMDVK